MTSDRSVIAREQRVRRQLAHFDCNLRKTPSRHWTRKYYPVGYMVVDWHNQVIAGFASREYEADIEDVELQAFERLPAKLSGRAA
jgi:hypothetical protein